MIAGTLRKQRSERLMRIIGRLWPALGRKFMAGVMIGVVARVAARRLGSRGVGPGIGARRMLVVAAKELGGGPPGNRHQQAHSQGRRREKRPVTSHIRLVNHISPLNSRIRGSPSTGWPDWRSRLERNHEPSARPSGGLAPGQGALARRF